MRAIVVASAYTNHAQAIAWNEIGRRAIMNDPLWRKGHYYDSPDGPPKDGLAVARMIGHVTYISEGAMDRKFGRSLQAADKESFSFGVDYAVESYLAYQGQHLPPALRPRTPTCTSRAPSTTSTSPATPEATSPPPSPKPAPATASSPTTPTGSTPPPATPT